MEQIHPDIPLDKAWKTGRRVYVRSSKGSKLSDGLWGINATWDRDEYAHWVGTGKLDKVIELVLGEQARTARADEIRSLGLWVKIPYAAGDIREHAKTRHHAVYGGDERKGEWAMPSQEALAEIRQMIADRAAADKTRKADAKAKKAAEDALTDDDIIARSGRTLASAERISVGGIMHGYMKRPEAEESKPARGDVVRMKDGTRILILKSSCSFWSQDDCDDQAPHEQPGWRWGGTAVRVEPTADELEDEARQEAERLDGEQLAALFTGKSAWEWEWLPETEARFLRPDQCAGQVREKTGEYTEGGTLSLTADGRVHYFHPGYYDDWRCTAGYSTSPAALSAVRSAIGAGPRHRAHEGIAYSVTAAGA